MRKTRKSRRTFLKAAAAGSAAVVSFPAIAQSKPYKLLMQSAWGGSDIFHLMAQQYVERVNKMSGGKLIIDLVPGGSLVPATAKQEAVHNGKLDAAHHAAVYWYSKNKAASLFGIQPVFGIDGPKYLAWLEYGGGKELYRELVQDILK